MIESQAFVMTNLRNGIDYLKATCKNAGSLESLLFLAVLKVFLKLSIIEFKIKKFKSPETMLNKTGCIILITRSEGNYISISQIMFSNLFWVIWITNFSY